MNSPIHEIDRRIQDALSAEDAELYEQFAVEPSLLELALDTLQGRNRLLSVLTIIVGTVFMGIGAYCLWQLLTVDSVRHVVQWSLAFTFCMAAVGMMKLWYWMEMQRISLTREIKRLELQLAHLANRPSSD